MSFKSKNQYNGLFIPRDRVGAGQLTIAGKDTALKLVRNKPWGPEEELVDFHGILSDGAKASLLQCVLSSVTNYRRGVGAQHALDVFPHYVLVGETFINSDDPVFRAIQYHFENVSSLVNGFGTFGRIQPERDEFVKILEADHRRQEKIARENGWPISAFEPEIGDAPSLLYHNGIWEIAKCSAQVGTVVMANLISYEMASSKGIGFANEITVRFEFSKPKTIEDAARSLWTLHSFFELCLGRRQRFLRIAAELVNERPNKEGSPNLPSELLCSYCNERVKGQATPTSYGDILLDPGARKDEFAKVLSGWLDSTPVMGHARNRFATAFHSGSYSVDRIVGAANMFDLLPETHAPTRKEPDEQTKEAIDECRKRFKALPQSFARDSVLSALGRVSAASLRDKVCHRADIIIGADPGRFSELHLPCSQAVLCRNHYVHGSPAAFEYYDNTSSFAFLTDTLEFVFAVSDLIELGWSYNFWRSKGSSLTHNFGSYVVNYDENLRRLKALLKIKSDRN